MIIDFTVRNFRSIAEEQVFSLHAEKVGKYHLDNVAYPDDKTAVLKVGAIYGPNASGKSNLLLAMVGLCWLVDQSAELKEGEVIPPYEPYALDADRKSSPIEFEIEFVASDKVRYRYSISYNAFEIISESLDSFLGRSRSNLFTRKKGDTWETMYLGSNLRGKVRRIPFFKNNSYVAKAGRTAGAPESLRAVFKYFDDLMYIGTEVSGTFTPVFLQEEENIHTVSRILSAIDTGVTGITCEEQEVQNASIFDSLPKKIRDRLLEEAKLKFTFWHKSDQGDPFPMDFKYESSGTKKLFHFIPIVIFTIARGGVLIVDELEASLHPHIAALFVKIFNDPDVNATNAQLIFTTHNTGLLDSQVMRRDQIWFVRKDAGSSTFYCLDEFDKKIVTPQSPIDEWYDEGRFGAVPKINYGAVADQLASAIYEAVDEHAEA
ncbi:AAA family ATPase [Asticcacaulis excentricus]|uniref:Putative abortive infection protein n=1 Tax=Asticcacaulis excentricus TaxID=78587 RepID=A0A3G9G519_9CAUL|nr:ATP-binding protein [Asticcacaulis excentricus]BBF81867.1 putative abortive infection protein [Asticcacaulis excentricus]